jgi:hypothetical protein
VLRNTLKNTEAPRETENFLIMFLIFRKRERIVGAFAGFVCSSGFTG